MDIVALYSFNGGRELMEAEHRLALNEIYEVIRGVDAAACLTKQSREKTRAYQMLYSPRALNRCFKTGFYPLGWRSVRVACHYPTAYYVDGYTAAQRERGEFREMDFVKEKVGVEVQFGKYSFMVYNVAAKMTVFHNLQHRHPRPDHRHRERALARGSPSPHRRAANGRARGGRGEWSRLTRRGVPATLATSEIHR